MVEPIQESVRAVLNKQPPGPASIGVKGDVEVNSGGWSGTLVKAAPQGFNFNVLLLDLKMTPPAGTSTQAVATIGVSFAEDPAAHGYTDVTIRNGSEEFTIAVQVVS